MSPVLETIQLSKQFGGVSALNSVNLQLREGEILGLIGANGAGKTTFINIVTGLDKPTHGTIKWRGQNVTGRPAYALAQMGLARTFQVMKPFRHLSVLENVAVGSMFGGARHSTGDAFARAEQILARVGLQEKQHYTASQLTVADLKRLELAKALAMEPRVLLLDEVMAGLNTGEIPAAVELVREINRSGITLLVVEHVMAAVMSLCQRIVVFEFGAVLAEGTPDEILKNPKVIASYLGERYAKRNAAAN